MPQGYGEHPNGRAAMERVRKSLRDSGIDPRKADRIARETARRVDRGAQPPPKPRPKD